MSATPDWEDWYDGVDDGDPDDAFDDMSCGQRADGTCELAGTEWCDWSCPHANDAAHNRSIRQRTPKHAPLLDLMNGDEP